MALASAAVSLLLLLNNQPQDSLLSAADAMVANTHFSAALTTAQTAAEFYVDSSIAGLIRLRDVEYLDKALTDNLPNMNLANDRVRGLYQSLTGDVLGDTSWYGRYGELVTIRNAAAHKARPVTKDEAEEMISIVRNDLIPHVRAAVSKLAPPS